MEGFAFESWFQSIFIKYLEGKERPIILFFDGHVSHSTYNTILAARENGIHIICLPPQTSSDLQPLDVGVFGPAKIAWQKILRAFLLESRNRRISKETFGVLLKQLYNVSFQNKPEYLVAGV